MVVVMHSYGGEYMVGLTANLILFSWLMLMLWLIVLVRVRPRSLQWEELIVL